MNTKVLILLALAALAAAKPDYRGFSSESHESYESSEAKYAFKWSVEDDSTGNDFDHQEQRDGDDTQGQYNVELPDGRKQTVTYVVDGDDGYVADVKYDGVARYPDHSGSGSFEFDSGSYSREYRRPRPSYFFDSNESK